MKKILSIFALSAVLAVMMAPVVATAVDTFPTGCVLQYNDKTTECAGATMVAECKDITTATAGNANCGMCCLLDIIYRVTSWIFFIMMVLAVLMIVIGGVMYMTAGQSPDNAVKGKNFITFAIIGLVVALIARFIPPVVKFFLGVK